MIVFFNFNKKTIYNIDLHNIQFIIIITNNIKLGLYIRIHI